MKKVLKGHANAITKLVKLDEENIASASDDKTVKIWNIN